MIGNDVVDLQVAQQESNWNRPRFLSKIFTQQEIAFINTAPDKNVAVWLLWSRKESVYKIISRWKKHRFFAPKKIENVNRINNFTSTLVSTIGQVHFEQHIFYTQSIITGHYIHTVAQFENKQKQPIIHCFFIEKNQYSAQSQTTRQQLLSKYAKLTQLPKKAVAIQKDEQSIPHLYFNNKKLPTIISMSHHGNYGAYAILPSLSMPCDVENVQLDNVKFA